MAEVTVSLDLVWILWLFFDFVCVNFVWIWVVNFVWILCEVGSWILCEFCVNVCREFGVNFVVNFVWILSGKKGCILCEPVNQISGTIFQEFSRCKFPRNFHAISRGFSRQFSCNFPWAELYGWLVARRGRRGMQEAHASVLENPRSHTWERCRMSSTFSRALSPI